MGWKVEVTDEAEKQMREDFAAGLIEKDDIVAMKKWVDAVESFGLEATQANKEWRDHELTRGKWVGHRAVSISYQGRLIYRVENNTVTVWVAKVTTEHDYT